MFIYQLYPSVKMTLFQSWR